ncbi:MAG: MtrB/PioB family decaheme-associated outer membrane protein [Rhodocyclaceae bacterium]|nr:MtrB/PioB family decaheme-associated outer membrane protein [Rhodocyclaceae bacterium]
MKAYKQEFSAKAMTLAVQGALVAMCAVPLGAYAQDAASDEVTALTQPTNFVQIGAGDVSKSSAKFGEYNGLDKNGGYVVGDFSVKGGDAYGQGTGTRRWGVTGTDLGTTSRNLSGSVSDQGSWSIGAGYDQLRHNISDSYQTPFQGSMGGNTFRLPASFGVINTAAPAFPNRTGSDALTAAQQASFQTQDVHSDRENTSFNAGFDLDQHWGVKFDVNHLKQSGAKLLGIAGDQANGVNGIPANLAWAGQTPFVVMNPTNYTTDTVNLAVNWAGDQAHVSASYFGSFFRDGYNSVSFNNPFVKCFPGAGNCSGAQTTAFLAAAPTGSAPAAGFPVDTFSTMPSNDFHQLNLSGGYAFNPATKLAGGLSYGRNTQNDAYAATGLTPAGLPQSSLNGLVVTEHVDLKLTNQTTKDLLLSAGLKYNDRDNRTTSNPYSFNTVNEASSVLGQGLSVNAPMSNKKTNLEFAGDYRIDKSQQLRLSYEYEKIRRWCNNAAANNQQGSIYNNGVTDGKGVLVGWTAYTAATCAEVTDSKENKLAANYKLKASDDLTFNAGYGYSRRKADISPSFYNPMQAVGGGAGGEGFEAVGFMAYFDASRKEQLLKAGVNWQANDKLTFTANGRYTDDKYDDLTYGVQKGNSASLNLDATYSYDEESSVSAYLTQQHSTRDLTNLALGADKTVTAANATTLFIPAGKSTWTNNLTENDTTFGLGAKKRGLMGGKLELAGDLTYSLGKSSYGTQFNYVSATTTPGLTCSSAAFETCGNLPDIKNNMVQLKLTGSYALDKASKVVMGYMYQHLNSNDYFYNALQYGNTPQTLLPTNQTAPTYTVNTVFAAYNYTFK